MYGVTTAKERQLWYWRNEVDARFQAWKENVEKKDVEGAKQAKAQYIKARLTLDELEKNQED